MQTGKAITSFLGAIWYGKELAKVEGWKNAQLWGSLLTALAALAAAFGFDLNLSDEAIGWGAAFAVAIANAVITAVTSKRAGLGRRNSSGSDGGLRVPPSGYADAGRIDRRPAPDDPIRGPPPHRSEVIHPVPFPM